MSKIVGFQFIGRRAGMAAGVLLRKWPVSSAIEPGISAILRREKGMTQRIDFQPVVPEASFAMRNFEDGVKANHNSPSRMGKSLRISETLMRRANPRA
jgi:hypothetical protein